MFSISKLKTMNMIFSYQKNEINNVGVCLSMYIIIPQETKHQNKLTSFVFSETDTKMVLLIKVGQKKRLDANTKAFMSCSILDSEKEPDYRDVTIRADVKVKELYDVEERLGT